MSTRVHPSQRKKPSGAIRMDTDCVGCKHYDSESGSCPAFPTGVPAVIFWGTVPHDEVRPDQQGGVVFAPRPDFEVEWLDDKGQPVE